MNPEIKKIPEKIFNYKRITFVVFLALSFTFITSAQTNLDKKITRGLNYLYNFQFDKSQNIFQELIDADSSNPAGYHFQSIAYLWYYLDSKKDGDLDKFLSYSDSAITIGRKLLNTELKDPNPFYILGSTYSYRALAFTRAGDYLKALWATKESYIYLNKAIELDSLCADAYFGLGLFNFAVSQTPSAWKWALDLTGITGNKKEGIEYLTFAANKGKFSAIDAQFYLSQLKVEFLSDFKSAHRYIDKLVKKYPRNLLFKSTAASLLVKEKKLKNAEKILFSISSSKDSSFKQIKNYANLLLGDIFFTQNNFDSAKTYYHHFLDSTIDNHFKGMTAYKLGLCYSFTDLPEEAAKYFGLVDEGNMDLDEDSYAMAMGEKYLENPPDSSTKKLILIKNFIDAGLFTKALNLLESLSQSSDSDSILTLINFYNCDVNYYMGNYKESRDLAVSLIENEFAEKWIRAFACYYAARASKKLGNIIDTQLFLSYANDFKDFYFQNKLRNLIYSLSFQFLP